MIKINNFIIILFNRVLVPLSKKLWEFDIPLLLCRSIGFLGYLRIQQKEHVIIESHPDNEVN